MGDLANKDKGEFTIVDPDNNAYEMHVDQYGSAQVQIHDAAGAALIGQKAMASSFPIVISSDQSPIPVSTNPSAPPDTTLVVEDGTSTVTKLGGTATTTYTIPNGEEVELTAFSFGGYLPTNTSTPLNCKCELYLRPNGTGVTTGQTLIFTIYLNSQSFYRETFNAHEVHADGDGTAVYEMVITNWSSFDAELFRQIRGYY